MTKKLKNLESSNSILRAEQWASFSNEPTLNGIACPKCGYELYDSSPMTTLTSMPAQKNVHCSKCDHVGYRID